MIGSNFQPALLTRKEIEWLLNRVNISKAYEYRIKSDIKKKLKTFTDLELPLLLEKKIIDNFDLSKYTQNLSANPQIKDQNVSTNLSNSQIQSQNMVGRKGFEPSNPAMSRLQETCFWEQYKKYLLTIVTTDTASDRLLYGRKYSHILVCDDGSELLALNHEKRIHVMKSLASLSKYLGCYDRWKYIRQKHQLKWSNGDALTAFNTIIDTKNSYSNMITWLKNAYSILPEEYGNILLYCALTGLRPDESFKSIQLIQKDIYNYLNKDSMTLEHFRYPNIFIRRTKKAYLSIATPQILHVAKGSCFSNYNTLKSILRRHSIEMKMSYCRKIFATYLRMNQIESETIDLLQGRIPKSVFARHYYKPDLTNSRIRNIINKLSNFIIS